MAFHSTYSVHFPSSPNCRKGQPACECVDPDPRIRLAAPGGSNSPFRGGSLSILFPCRSGPLRCSQPALLLLLIPHSRRSKSTLVIWELSPLSVGLLSPSGPVDSSWKPEALRGHSARANHWAARTKPPASSYPVHTRLVPSGTNLSTTTKTQQA